MDVYICMFSMVVKWMPCWLHSSFLFQMAGCVCMSSMVVKLSWIHVSFLSRKFICLNSNLDPKSKSNDLIHALVQDTYESLFPLPSSFELPLNYRNRFLYVEELVAWRKWRDFVRALIYACLASLVFLTLVNFFSTEVRPATVPRLSAEYWQSLGVVVAVLFV